MSIEAVRVLATECTCGRGHSVDVWMLGGMNAFGLFRPQLSFRGAPLSFPKPEQRLVVLYVGVGREAQALESLELLASGAG